VGKGDEKKKKNKKKLLTLSLRGGIIIIERNERPKPQLKQGRHLGEGKTQKASKESTIALAGYK
jgi:hypothetical protein